MSSSRDAVAHATDPLNRAVPPRAEPHKLGVLLVHGIGEQREGETLLAFGEPLIHWLRQWLAQHDRGTSRGSVAVARADLTPSKSQKDEPAHTVLAVAVNDAGGGQVERSTWLLAEGWWGDRIQSPPFGKLAVWMLTVGAWLILAHGLKSIRTPAGSRWQYLQDFCALVVLLPVVAVTQAVVALLAVVAALPIPQLRAALSEFLLKATGILGDAFVFVDSEVQRAAIVTKARKDLEWLAARCSTVVVVAHSQGAAVAHQALRAPQPCQVKLLLTFGSGLARLEELAMMSARHRGTLALAALSVPFAFLAAALTVRVLTQFGADEFARLALYWALLPLLLVLAAVVQARAARAEFDQQVAQELSLRAAQPQLDWLDVYASADPVPNGPLPEGKIPGLKARQVTNLGSRLRDHTSYWHNQAEFIPTVLGQIDQSAQLNLFRLPEDGERLRAAAVARTRRVQWLCRVRASLVVCAALVAVWTLWDRLPALSAGPTPQLFGAAPFAEPGKLLEGLGRLIAGPLSVPTGVEVAVLENVGYGLLGGAVLLVLIWFWQRLHLLLWRWWDRLETSQALQPNLRPEHWLDRVSVPCLVVLTGFAPLLLAVLFQFWPSLLAPATVEARLYWTLGLLMLAPLAFAVLALGAKCAAAVRKFGAAVVGGGGEVGTQFVEVLALLTLGVPVIAGVLFITPGLPQSWRDFAVLVVVLWVLARLGLDLHAGLLAAVQGLSGSTVWFWAGVLLPFSLTAPVGWFAISTGKNVTDTVLSLCGAYLVGLLLLKGVVALVDWAGGVRPPLGAGGAGRCKTVGGGHGPVGSGRGDPGAPGPAPAGLAETGEGGSGEDTQLGGNLEVRPLPLAPGTPGSGAAGPPDQGTSRSADGSTG